MPVGPVSRANERSVSPLRQRTSRPQSAPFDRKPRGNSCVREGRSGRAGARVGANGARARARPVDGEHRPRSPLPRFAPAYRAKATRLSRAKSQRAPSRSRPKSDAPLRAVEWSNTEPGRRVAPVPDARFQPCAPVPACESQQTGRHRSGRTLPRRSDARSLPAGPAQWNVPGSQSRVLSDPARRGSVPPSPRATTQRRCREPHQSRPQPVRSNARRALAREGHRPSSPRCCRPRRGSALVRPVRKSSATRWSRGSRSWSRPR